MTQLQKHEKAIIVLEAIEACNRRILSLQTDIKTFPIEFIGWPSQRLEIVVKVKNRIQNYYDKNFKL